MERGEEGGVAAWYNYTADGTRNFKLRSPRLNIQQNASLFDSPPLVYPTLYASPLITLTQSGYTKHYFEEGRRICSKLGGGFADRVPSGEIDARVNEIEHSYAKLSQYQHDGVMESFTNCFGATPVLADRYDLRMMLRDYRGDERLFFYHNDHLGSAAYITDESSQVTQTLNYLPYGEDWVEVRNDFDPRIGQYTFNGKEKDHESGFHYYGARYYWSELLTGWLSVDPMSDKYPSISPYNYCMWNPVKLIDPDGRFPIRIHKEIVSEALASTSLAVNVQKKILYGVGVSSDVWRMGNATIHLDNINGFESLRELYTHAMRDYSANMDRGDYIAAGRNLHTIADFYSHSNYIELYGQYAAENGLSMSIKDIPSFSEIMNNEHFEKYVSEHGGMRTGTFSIAGWISEYIFQKQPTDGSHSQMNLDEATSVNGGRPYDARNPYSPSRHAAAKAAAQKETNQIVQKLETL